jgi:acyl-coenzyme A thioesterase PaaI-like protein
MPNRLNRLVAGFNKYPPFVKKFLVTQVFSRTVPFVGTSRIKIEELSESRVVMTIANKRRVQNHIKTVHAAAMTLLAESATGILMGMNVPDDKYLVVKSLHVDFQKKASGDMKAFALLTPEQVHAAQTDAEGEIMVEVHVTDVNNSEPITCQMLWAWKPKRA